MSTQRLRNQLRRGPATAGATPGVAAVCTMVGASAAGVIAVVSSGVVPAGSSLGVTPAFSSMVSAISHLSV